jgi:hypothetical protein
MVACRRRAVSVECGTYSRSKVWSDPVSLWEDTAAQSPGKSRVHQQLAQAFTTSSAMTLAAAEYGKSTRLETPDYKMLMNWGSPTIA